MNLQPYRPGLGLIGTGLILWLIGILVPILLPLVGAIGAVLILVGTLLFWIGVAILIIQIIIAAVRGAL